MNLVFLFILIFASVVSADFDPNLVTVESPTAEVYAELPSGDVRLKDYRAPSRILQRYCELHDVKDCETKDFAKAPNCTRAEIHKLKDWSTVSGYQAINEALRIGQKGKVKGQPILEKTEIHALVMASAVNCAPQYEGIAVRLEGTPKRILAQYLSGKFIIARGFTSVSKGTELAESILSFKHMKEKICYDKVSGADLDVLGLSGFKEEKEVILRPGTVFKVRERSDYPQNSINRFWTILDFIQVN